MSSWENLIVVHATMTGVSSALKRATLAQWILESGRGTSKLAREHFNFAGIKFRARMAGYCEAVDYRGSDGELTTYCKFAGVESFVAGYWHFIESGPYDGWQDYHDDAPGYIRHLFKSGYAADPEYVGKVLSLFSEADQLMAGSGGGISHYTAGDNAIARMAIIVGHNRLARGASAGSPISTTEFPFNSRVANHMKDEADEYNLQCEVFFREPAGSYTREIAQAYAAVALWKPDCCVELHFNSGPSAATGTETLVGRNRAEARALADNLQEEILGTLNLRDRKVKIVESGDRGSGSLYALPAVPTVIVEPFFGSNSSDCLRVGSLGEVALARAYLRGVRDWAVAHHIRNGSQ